MPRGGGDAADRRGALTPFQAFMTALAASTGTGNVAGVATAITSGGPGALFWIWAYGVVAMAIKLTEAVLGRRFRVATRLRHRRGRLRTAASSSSSSCSAAASASRTAGATAC